MKINSPKKGQNKSLGGGLDFPRCECHGMIGITIVQSIIVRNGIPAVWPPAGHTAGILVGRYGPPRQQASHAISSGVLFNLLRGIKKSVGNIGKT